MIGGRSGIGQVPEPIAEPRVYQLSGKAESAWRRSRKARRTER
jgi:hypothetical protein